MRKRITKDIVKEKAVDIGCSIAASAMNLVLLSVSMVEPTFSSDYRVVSRAMDKAIDEVLMAGVTKETVKKAIHKAIYRKHIKRVNGKSLALTKEGWEKINSVYPTYKIKRDWNGQLFLITYDIPEEDRAKRDAVRKLIKRLGGGLLQKSVWLCLYDPKPVLNFFARDNRLQGTIIVSNLGQDGAIGEEDLDDLVERVFGLDEINRQYRSLIDQLREGNMSKIEAVSRYLTVLDTDPQLPFKILPFSWLGDKAYRLIKEYCPNCKTVVAQKG